MEDLPKPIRYALLSAIPLVGIAIIVGTVYVSYGSLVHDGYPIGAVLWLFCYSGGVGVFLLWIGWLFITTGMAQFRFSKEGLYAKYPLKPEQLIPWRAFQQVCVCYCAYTTRGPRRACTIICCVKHGEKRNLYGRWKADNLFRYRTVIAIKYSPELHAGVKEMCPYEVVDLRETRAYRLN